MGSPKTGPTWRDVSRSVKTQKAKNKLIPKKFEKVTLTNQKTRSFWRHLRQYLNNIVLPPLKKIKSKKISELFQSIQLHSKKTNPIICNLRKKYKSSEATSKNTHHKTKRRKSK